MKKEVLNNITHQQVQLQVQEKLAKILSLVRILSDIQVFSSRNNDYDIQAIANINDNEQLNIICEVKLKGEPKYIRAAIHNLIDIKNELEVNSNKRYLCLIAAPYISTASSKICEEFEIGCIDLSGNCLIAHEGIYIRIEGKPNKYKEVKGKSTSIFERRSVKSSLVLRHLFNNSAKRWKVQELADISGTSIGQVANVKKYLEEREYLSSDDVGFFVGKPKELIQEWAEIYNQKANMTYEYYSALSIQQIEEKLMELEGFEYAVTGFSGGVRYSPTVRYNKVHVYMSYVDLEEAVLRLGLKQVTSGSNVSIIVPYDSCIMLDSRNIRQLMVASPLQVCLELLALKGRGEEAAYAIMEKEF